MRQSAANRKARVAAPLRHQVSEWLREDIVSGQFAAGERLVERDLCERYEVSRTVVREALRQLEASGLVTTVANKGPEVARVTRADVVAVYEVRAVLEGLAGRLFAERASDEDKVGLGETVDKVAAAMEDGDIREVLASKDAFYVHLFAGAANPVITATLRALHARIQMMRGLSLSAPGRSEVTLRELRGIVAATQAGDGPRAAIACEEHVRAAGAVALATLDARADGDRDE